jgi:hypothetical protein
MAWQSIRGSASFVIKSRKLSASSSMITHVASGDGSSLAAWRSSSGTRPRVYECQSRLARSLWWICARLPEGRFPPRVDESYVLRRRIEWIDAFDVVKLFTGRRPRFTAQQLYGNDPAVIAAYSTALRGPCQPLLVGDESLWARLRRQRTARIAHTAG